MQAGPGFDTEIIFMIIYGLVAMAVPLTSFIMALLAFLRVRRIEMMVIPRDEA